MARGAPDYGNVLSASPLHRVDDMAELAARLGSPVTHDRCGYIVFLESFSYGLGGWTVNEYGEGADVSPSPESFRTGPFSCKMIAGKTEARCAKINRRFPYPTLNKYGFEFSIQVGNYVEYIDWVLGRMDGTIEHQFYCHYDDSANIVQIKDVEGDYVTVAEDVDLAFTYAGYQTIKLVVDLETNMFVRLMINEKVYHLPEYPAYPHPNVDKPTIRPDIKIWGNEYYNGWAYVDDIIITQNEP